MNRITARLVHTRIVPLALALALAAVLCAGAQAAGGPPSVYMSAGKSGVVSPDGRSRYVTLSTDHGTMLTHIATNGGRVLSAPHTISGYFGVPAVAQDRTPGGLSADGRILVLSKPYITLRQSRTTFLLFHTNRLRSPRRITLSGAFTFDALSPDGSKLYLTEYQSKFDPTHFAIREYNVQAGRLLKKPILDPTEAEEDMRGSPVTRVTSPDDRFAYTLYDGGSGTPFVHTLDTEKATTMCVDIDALADRRLGRVDLRVSDDGRTISLSDDTSPIATMETATFVVTTPETTAGDGGSGGIPWIVLVLAGLVAAGITAAIRVVHRRRRVAAT